MRRICVRPDDLKQLGTELDRSGGLLRQTVAGLHGAMGRLDWETRQQVQVEEQVAAARRQGMALAEQAESLAQFLASRAELFRQADARGVTPWDFGQEVPPFGMAAAAAAAGAQAGVATPAAPRFDGESPAPGTTDTRAWIPVAAPLTNQSGSRGREAYGQVIDQFAVGENDRYRQRDGNTYCNIFVWDVTRAMGAEIPHWVTAGGDPAPVGKGMELSANGVADWLDTHGSRYGWREVTAEEAQALANAGQPAVAVSRQVGGIGHVAMVRPGEYSPTSGPAIANAGANNLNQTTVAAQFGKRPVSYYVHD